MKLTPLGAVAPLPDGSAWTGHELDRASPMAPELRDQVASYLVSCPLFLPWMEYTRDVLEDRFGVSGGSAIASDGVYYWRLDGADYVREYGVAIPNDAISHFSAQQWQPPSFTRAEYDEIYQHLLMLSRGEIVG